jgi:hypothetical protein
MLRPAFKNVISLLLRGLDGDTGPGQIAGLCHWPDWVSGPARRARCGFRRMTRRTFKEYRRGTVKGTSNRWRPRNQGRNGSWSAVGETRLGLLVPYNIACVIGRATEVTAIDTDAMRAIVENQEL